MNYQRLHDAIIAHHQQNPPTGYTEKHHIVPRCMGGTNDKTNLVRLTARAHFVVHRILCKIYPDHAGIVYAFAAMYMTTKRRCTGIYWNRSVSISRTFQALRKKMSTVYTNKVLPPEHRKAISDSLVGRMKSPVTRQLLSDRAKVRYVNKPDPHIGRARPRKDTAGWRTSQNKKWKITTPTNELVTVINLAEYCRTNGLNLGHMSAVASGRSIHHKGYKVACLGKPTDNELAVLRKIASAELRA